MANGKNDNGNGGNSSARGKRITRDDLQKSIEAAREAAQAAAGAAEATLVALNSEMDEDLPPEDMTGDEDQGQRDGRGGQQASGPLAYEEFMARLKSTLDKAGASVQVSENAAWIKIESRRNGHKVYLAKGKTQVNRIESTLPPEAVPGAVEPDRKNGRIASWIPADLGAVTVAIRQLATSDSIIRPPQRGGGQGGGGSHPQGGGSQGGSGPGSAGGGRRRGLLN